MDLRERQSGQRSQEEAIPAEPSACSKLLRVPLIYVVESIGMLHP